MLFTFYLYLTSILPSLCAPSHILPSLISSFHLNNFSIIYSLLSFVSRPSFHNPSSSFRVHHHQFTSFHAFRLHFVTFISPISLHHFVSFHHHFSTIIINISRLLSFCVHYLISPPLIITISRPLLLSFRVRHFINIIENHYSAS